MMNAFDEGIRAQLAILVAVASCKGSEFTRVAGELGCWAYSRITRKYDDESAYSDISDDWQQCFHRFWNMALFCTQSMELVFIY
jgi:hypothetical protein